MWMYVTCYCEKKSRLVVEESSGYRFVLWMCLFPLCCRGCRVSTAKWKRPIHSIRISSSAQDQATRHRKCFGLSDAVTSRVSESAMAFTAQKHLPRHKSWIFPFKLCLLTFTRLRRKTPRIPPTPETLWNYFSSRANSAFIYWHFLYFASTTALESGQYESISVETNTSHIWIHFNI